MTNIALRFNHTSYRFVKRCFSSSTRMCGAVKLQSVRGMADKFDGDVQLASLVQERFNEVVETYGCVPIETPLVEPIEVFTRSLGDASEMIGKEMYTLNDRSDNQLALRPEGTAGVVRALVESGRDRLLPQRFSYCGPFFRYERPQKGRQRQFRQFGIESFASKSLPQEDAEIIAMAHQCLERIEMNEKLELQINTLGDAESRQRYVVELDEYFKKHVDSMSKASQHKLKTGRTLRILDSSDEDDKKIIQAAPSIHDSLSKSCSKRFDIVLSTLKSLGIEYNLNERLVRGLDYYTHTIFEFVEQPDKRKAILGRQQATALAGGRYDGLVGQFGGVKHTSSIGWAAGIERLLLMLQENSTANANQHGNSGGIAVVATTGQRRPVMYDDDDDDNAESFVESTNTSQYGFVLAQRLRAQGINVFLQHDGSLRRQLNRANKRGIETVVIVGEEELERQVVLVRNMSEGTEPEFNVKTDEDVENLITTLEQQAVTFAGIPSLSTDQFEFLQEKFINVEDIQEKRD